jgi:hypothetical protein
MMGTWLSKDRINRLINIPYLLALLLCIPFMLYFFIRLEKYSIEITSRSFPNKKNEVNYWADIDGDGAHEQIQTFINRDGKAALTIRNSENEPVNQWNFETDYRDNLRNRSVVIHDLDRDNQPEICFLTERSKQIFLNIIKPGEKNKVWMEEIFVDSITSDVERPFYSAGIFHETISNPEKPFDDLFIFINAGFSRIPRKVYRFSVTDSLLKRSDNLSRSGINQLFVPQGNQDPEIIIAGSSTANAPYPEQVFPNDHFSWLIVLNKKLDFKFAPKMLGGLHSSPKATRLNIASFDGYVIYQKEIVQHQTEYSLLLFDENGRQIVDYNPGISLSPESSMFLFNDRPLVINNNAIYSFSKDLKLKRLFQLAYEHPLMIQSNDGRIQLDEHLRLAYSRNDLSFFIVDLKDHELINLKRTMNPNELLTFFQVEDKEGNMQFAVQHSDELQKFMVVPSLWFQFRWLVAAMIYLLLLALVVLIRRIQQIQFQRQLDDERRVAVLKARSLKNLVNPHFTLNALDAISGLVSRSSAEHAKSYISKFARMIHSLMSRSDDLFVPLGQELEFVKDYLDLQQLRFESVFEYRIELSDEVKVNRLIPKILIQTFAENAVRHGLRPKEKDGLLLIQLSMEQEYLKILVEDNGIGRKAALEQDTTHTGTGLKVIYQLIEILKYHADEPVRFHTHDLLDNNGQPAGTRVEVLLPEFRESVWEE